MTARSLAEPLVDAARASEWDERNRVAWNLPGPTAGTDARATERVERDATESPDEPDVEPSSMPETTE